MKKLIKKIVDFFSGKKREKLQSESQTNSDKATEESSRRELLEKYQTKFDEIASLADQNDETVINSITKHINGFAFGYYKNWGIADGIIGTRDFQILKTAKVHGIRIAEHVNSKLSGRVAALEYSIGEKEIHLENLKGSMNKAKEVLNDIKEDENDDDKQFNKFQAWFCVLFGLAMIISDVVVSLNLVTFFGVGRVHDKQGASDGLWAKLCDGELLMFSLGIAFCTMYIKILYDDYINTKFGFFEKEKNKILRRNKDITKSSLSFEYYIKLIVKLIILAGLLTFLYYLAKYRTYFTIRNTDEISNAISTTGSISPIILNSFIGISVIIPIISGICLSVGFRIFGRRKIMKKAKLQYDLEMKNHKECYDEIFNLKSKKEEISTFQKEWVSGDKKVQNISELFANNYNQGFREGYARYFGNDLYVLVENYRNEVINIALTNKINNTI